MSSVDWLHRSNWPHVRFSMERDADSFNVRSIRAARQSSRVTNTRRKVVRISTKREAPVNALWHEEKAMCGAAR
jgi:hypothetical protein